MVPDVRLRVSGSRVLGVWGLGCRGLVFSSKWVDDFGGWFRVWGLAFMG